MGATNTMALYTTALLGYISFLPSSPVITLATPSLASQEDNSDLDDIIPDLLLRQRTTARARPTPTPTTTFFMTSIKGIAPPPAPSCTISGSPVVESVIIHSPTLPSSPAVSSFPNSPNNLFTLSDLKHRDPDYIQADSTIYANDSTWRWWNYLVKHRGSSLKHDRGAIKHSYREVKGSFLMKKMGRRYDLVPTTKPAERSVAPEPANFCSFSFLSLFISLLLKRGARTTRRCDDQ
ncbi:hypothetical protein D6C85_10700 [Aureobasidium pullulans]|uniref:Uncharacterized protein n=1 Tax=Aureobasidium pullulans TaxID=5580 RepID=A0A4S9VU90_AURPU|nr:hypothetical protein D6C85_10700 [Aureobasidium pullulans]